MSWCPAERGAATEQDRRRFGADESIQSRRGSQPMPAETLGKGGRRTPVSMDFSGPHSISHANTAGTIQVVANWRDSKRPRTHLASAGRTLPASVAANTRKVRLRCPHYIRCSYQNLWLAVSFRACPTPHRIPAPGFSESACLTDIATASLERLFTRSTKKPSPPEMERETSACAWFISLFWGTPIASTY